MTTDTQTKNEQETKQKKEQESNEIVFVSKTKRPKYIMQPKKDMKTAGMNQEGKYVIFEKHKFVADIKEDKEKIEFLRNHSDFGNEFWEKGKHKKGEMDTKEGVNPDVEGMQKHDSDAKNEKVENLEERVEGLEEKFEETTGEIMDKLDSISDDEEENEEGEEEKKKPKNVKNS